MNVPVPLTLDTRLADDVRVFFAKAMQGSESVAAEHPLTMEFLRRLPKQIDTAAGYQREIGEQNRAEVTL